MKLLKRLYMKNHGFIRRENRWLKTAAWIRKGHEGSALPTNMILEDLLFELPWKEIVKRYGNKKRIRIKARKLKYFCAIPLSITWGSYRNQKLVTVTIFCMCIRITIQKGK